VNWYNPVDWLRVLGGPRREGGGGRPSRSYGTPAGLSASRWAALRRGTECAVRLRPTGLRRFAELLYGRLGLLARMRWLGIAWTVPKQSSTERAFGSALCQELSRHGFPENSIDAAIWVPALGSPERPVFIVSHWGTISYVFVRSFGQDLYVGLHSFVRIMPGFTPIVLATAIAILIPVLMPGYAGVPGEGPRWLASVISALAAFLGAAVAFLVAAAVLGWISLSRRTLRGPGIPEADDYQMVVNSLVSLIEGEIVKRVREVDSTADLGRVLRREWLYSTPSQATFPFAGTIAPASGTNPPAEVSAAQGRPGSAAPEPATF